MKILHLDKNHPLLINQLDKLGFINHEDYTSSKTEIQFKIKAYDGLVIRSRLKIDEQFLNAAYNLKFIARVGSGLENIDTKLVQHRGIKLITAPEGNSNAVGEHALAMLLSLLNNLQRAHNEVKQGIWKREANRGYELDGKTVGIIGYGNTGKAFARKLTGFKVKVLCVDIKANVGNRYAKQVSLTELQAKADVLSLHIPETPLTVNMVDKAFIDAFKRRFWIINTARGRCVVTPDLVAALKSGKILGAGLDVLEYEQTSFEKIATQAKIPFAFRYLSKADNVVLSPHIAGWTVESKIKLAEIVADKISNIFL